MTSVPVAAFSDDGELLAVYANPGTDICVWQRDSKKVQSRLSNRRWLNVTCLAWSHVRLPLMLLAQTCRNTLTVLIMQNSSRRKRRKHAAVSSITCPLLAVAGRHGVAVFDVMQSEEISLLVGDAGLASSCTLLVVIKPMMCDQPCREEVCNACWVGNNTLYLADKTSDVTEWSYATASVRRSVSKCFD